MAKLTRVLQKLFASTPGVNQVAQFGSLAAGSALFSTDPAVIQGLSNWLTGWNAAVIGGASPTIEDMNGMCLVFAYQLAYLFQAGIAEWDATTTYYLGSLVNSSGTIYQSLTNGNTGNAVTDDTNWATYANRVRLVSATDAAQTTDGLIRCDAALASFVETLPPVASVPIGKRITVKCINSNANTVTAKGNAAELIDFANTVVLRSGNSITVSANGTGWDII